MTPAPADAQPVAWIQPDHLAKARKAPFLCRVEPTKRDDFVPLYVRPHAAPAQDVGEVITKAQLERLRLRGLSSIVGGDIRAALAELTRLRAALDAANARADANAKDAERLDWLISEAVGSAMHMGAVLYDPQLVVPRDMKQADVRAAIDAAKGTTP